MIKSGARGVSDLVGIAPDGTGRIVCCECKTEIGKTTVSQQEFMDRITKDGGIAFVVRSVDDFVEEIKKLKNVS